MSACRNRLRRFRLFSMCTTTVACQGWSGSRERKITPDFQAAESKKIFQALRNLEKFFAALDRQLLLCDRPGPAGTPYYPRPRARPPAISVPERGAESWALGPPSRGVRTLEVSCGVKLSGWQGVNALCALCGAVARGPSFYYYYVPENFP